MYCMPEAKGSCAAQDDVKAERWRFKPDEPCIATKRKEVVPYAGYPFNCAVQEKIG